MAKDKVASKGADKDKKKKKAIKAEVGGVKIKVKAGPRGGERKKAKASTKSAGAGHSGFEALAKLADHPIIADLIAVGATAAVAALAKRGMDDGKAAKSSTAAKAAGKAAAAAIGKRLMTELQGVKDAAVDAAKKS
jgi:hypothetical protein